jgi:methylated-DNA-[protein]-cysteine S-methyltransferase
VASFSHVFLPSALGIVALVWREQPTLKVVRVLLPREKEQAELALRSLFPESRSTHHPTISEFGARLQTFLEGQATEFDLNLLALEDCSEFQRRVLLADYSIPRGRVSTYGRIANRLGVPKGARAVGGALAHNPFPLIIPCHRALSADGGMGGFQGGLPMKQRLLELEGVPFSESGNAPVERFYY